MTSTTTTISPTSGPTLCFGPGVELCSDGSCHDTKTDVLNCGRCNNVCAFGKQCINGVCASPACDSRCGFDRQCGSGNATTTCICATTVEGNGVCFDKSAYSCDNSRLVRCSHSEFGEKGCPIGSVCVSDVCNCGVEPAMGMCVATTGCGDEGTNAMGALVRIGEMERRRRTVREFGQ
ncbi:Stig1 domain containing protein [Pyrenophora tritici-repentis]|uniref:Uncharacterized protein n=1 Tax=Pyrenophora tritici-repentis TaxID=45151 RepID=A0A5M9LDL0_9PLEO|nr:Stig1 domain-containing protein [Pyrenophora tritici-repentis]KAF7452284.1 Stig1 domain containing protein [Pyrenophora tritici-repentis]KAF7574594.1 hypothetical protein PtrM4_062170 [Pyrenophora tritici-repentis]KAI0586209.1 Stig1 domain-containing protein [Pyrenophora tritici-repentis]KAI0590893.1 Stig1 domain-containing protein [Pyrenophora tritici-repentis]